jgi:hypothetical protein
MDPQDNPYRPGAGTAPPALMGRNDLIDRFGVSLRRALDRRPGKSLMPIGLRGVGKTVLLNRFAEIAEQEGCRVAHLESPETGDFRLLLAVMVRRILLAFNQMGPAKGVLKALRVLKAFTLTLPEGGQIKIDVDAMTGSADSGVLAEDIIDLLVATGEGAADKKLGVLLSIDEVQYLSESELAALVAGIHRTTQLNLPVILVGAGLPQLPGLAGQAKSYAERLFDFPEIGSLDFDDAAAAIAIPARDQDVDLDDAALKLVVREANGYPYFLQEWGYQLWNHAPRSPITADDVRSVRPIVLDQLDRNFFLVRFDRLTPKEKEYLRAMAHLGPGPHRSGDIAATLDVRVESVAPRRSELISKGMIYSPAHGDTAFTVPLFAEYLNRAMPDWRPPSKRPAGKRGRRR